MFLSVVECYCKVKSTKNHSTEKPQKYHKWSNLQKKILPLTAFRSQQPSKNYFSPIKINILIQFRLS